jgi:uncharacterized Fe-S cluster-containing MiaB family protein
MGGTLKLPRLDIDVFKKLVSEAHLSYDKSKGVYKISSRTDIHLLKQILKETLNENIVFTIRCSICGNSSGCSNCGYLAECDKTKLSPACICEECLSKSDPYALYSVNFVEKRLA